MGLQKWLKRGFALLKAEIISIKKSVSRDGSELIIPCFKLEDGKSAKSYLSPKYGNFSRWKPVLKVGMVIENFILRGNSGIIDGDSCFRVVR